jgi:hypothetical protein
MARALALAVLIAAPGAAQEIARDGIAPEQFSALHALVKPRPGEFAWYDDIPWLTSVQEAREKAAAQGKPLLVWCSADGQPCGAT